MLRNRAGQGVIVLAVTVIFAYITTVVYAQTHDPFLLTYWGVTVTVTLLSLAAFLRGRGYTHLPVAPGRVLAVVPAYNEHPDALRACVESLLKLTIEVDVVVMDDGSQVPVVPFEHPRVTWLRQENTGKRGAQVAVLRRFRAQDHTFIMTVDSDSQPYPDALEHLLRAMSDPRIQAATGWIYVRNYKAGLVARAADIDIGTSCVMMRSSRSMLGAIETTSGALALYRSAVLYDFLDEYARDTWGAGDDRWLTTRANLRGQVVAVNEAIVESEMPETIVGTFRQRKRWARSWFLMSAFVWSRYSPRQMLSPLLGLIHLAVAPIGLIAGAVWAVVAVASGRAGVFPWRETVVYVCAYVMVRYALSAMYLVDRRNVPVGQKLLSWLVGTPAAIVMQLAVLIPARYYALLRLRDRRWSTREVPVPAPAPLLAQRRRTDGPPGAARPSDDVRSHARRRRTRSDVTT